MRLIRIHRRAGMVVKIFHNGQPSHPFEYRLQVPACWRTMPEMRRGWRYDSTSHLTVAGAAEAALEAALWYRANRPRAI